MRVVCFVPSLTETFIEAGIEVIGRTRFCIHPQEKIKNIPIVGGTKDAQWDKVQDLKPDLVIFDKEENTLEMANQCPVPFYATHITSVESLASELKILSEKLKNHLLKDYSERAKSILHKKKKSQLVVLEELNTLSTKSQQALYLIWRDPWMAVSRETFIGSVCHLLGTDLPEFVTKYPQIELSDYEAQSTRLLFSSEPFPFHKFKEELKKLPYTSAIVDGESYSWFGIRAIKFLESVLKD